MTELVLESFQELLDFYAGHHADACFGSLDLPALQQAMQALRTAAGRVEAAEAGLSEARDEFAIAEAEVLSTAARAVSFLKIHVEGDGAQVARLDAIGDGLCAQRRKSIPGSDGPAPMVQEVRRRPRKAKNANASQSSLLHTGDSLDETPNDADSELNTSTQVQPASVSSGTRRGAVAAE